MVACVGLSTSLLESATNKNYVSLEQRRVSTAQHVLVLVVPRAERREERTGMIHARYSPTLGRHLTKIFRPLGPIAHQLVTAPTYVPLQ